ncbi:MAG: undecaprenyl-diphosphate phosphatase [Oleiphilaceae bacterium]|nr:undecaprenyl-diphosphate phosphatase [Oleiphilaceae bacterium]
MDILQIIVLALVQGLTEILPVSSSAHLVLVPVFTGWRDQGLSFDVALHVGTVMAVILYFRKDLFTMATAWLRSVTGGGNSQEAQLAWGVILGTIPAGAAGLLLGGMVETHLRSPFFVAFTLIGFALLLWFADIRGKRQREVSSIGISDAVMIGMAQALALMPGVSRSGVTMTAGLALGLTRVAAARFSFLLSVPVILAAGSLETVHLVRSEEAVEWAPLFWGALLAGITTYACVHLLLKLLNRVGMWPFVLYRLVLGTGLLILFW